MDRICHSIRIFPCLTAPRHTAFKTKKNRTRSGKWISGRMPRQKTDPPPARFFNGLPNVTRKTADFALWRRGSRLFLRYGSFVSCRSPPFFVSVTYQFTTETEEIYEKN